MVEDALDRLYSARPDEFTSLRAELAARAKGDGDPDAARRIAASRKPTTAAWVVNVLVLGGTARTRLTDLGTRLRESHAAMDGAAIRTLTAEQRRLVDELVRDGFRVAGLTNPAAAVRDSVTTTLQAAIADPDVAARLGRLSKAEQWSGFGEFGSTAAVSTAARDKATERVTRPRPEQAKRPSTGDRRRQQARAELAAAARAKADADEALTELQADLAAARLRHQDAQRRLADAEQALTAARDAYEGAKQAGRDAAAAVKAAKLALKKIPD
ncbi:hypothetical protein [Mycolicibacterium hippocampi]|uniref:hypothetical protein n=1 Tax=Mycolicibacterium hippocampi TaxID=659824 RepID=UPI0035162972